MVRTRSGSPLPISTGDPPVQQDHGVVRRVAVAKEDLAHRDRPDVPVLGEQVQLRVAQLREHRRVVVVEERGRCPGVHGRGVGRTRPGHTRPRNPLSTAACTRQVRRARSRWHSSSVRIASVSLATDGLDGAILGHVPAPIAVQRTEPRPRTRRPRDLHHVGMPGIADSLPITATGLRQPVARSTCVSVPRQGGSRAS